MSAVDPQHLAPQGLARRDDHAHRILGGGQDRPVFANEVPLGVGERLADQLFQGEPEEALRQGVGAQDAALTVMKDDRRLDLRDE